MADIVNLRRFRKAAARAAEAAAAADHRLAFGRRKAERQQADAERRLAERLLDAHRRDQFEPPESSAG